MLSAAWSILAESAFFILIGFVLAGVLEVVLTGTRAVNLLRGRGPRSVFLATLVGVPLPLCSCSVLPTAMTLRRKGASKGATLSFLISTPETTITSILLTYALLGPVMAIYRPIAACITALTAGFIENARAREEETGALSPLAKQTAGSGEAGGTSLPVLNQPEAPISAEPVAAPWQERLRLGMRYAFVDLFDDIFGWVLIGILAAAAIQIWLPPDVLQRIASGPLEASLLMVVIGVPLYVCAEASTPIAAVLIAQGLNPGAALVFLLVGPATNIGSLGVLRRELGPKTLAVYLSSIIVVALFMGAVLNDTLANSTWDLAIRPLDEPLVPEGLKVLGATVFLALGLGTARRRKYLGRLAAVLDRAMPVRVTSPRLGWTMVVLALAAYALSGFFVVEPGEIGIVRRFGAVVRSNVPPGLHYAWPFPIEQVDRVSVKRVWRTELGMEPAEALRESDDDTSAEPSTEGWVLVGDENIADVDAVVHWGVAEEEWVRFRFATADRERLVQSVVSAAFRERLAGLAIHELLTAGRQEAEREVLELAQRRLDAYGSGIRVDAFRILDAHAPPEVHSAFRDVASALEDRATYVNQARAMEARVLPMARSDAVGRLAEADGYAAQALARAMGEAGRYLELWQVYAAAPRVTALRLEIEMLEQVLPRLKTYIKPATESEGAVDVWFLEQGKAPRPADWLPD